MSDTQDLGEPAHALVGAMDVSARLRHAIEHGDVVRGGRLLPERDLAEAIGVGRHQLRQVLSGLEAEGVIWRRQGHGTFVTDLTPPQTDHFQRAAMTTSPAEVMDVRLELEPLLARYCALRASADQVTKIRLTASTIIKAATSTQFASSDAAFHRAVAEGTNNTLFIAMFESVMAVLRQADWRAVRHGTFSPSRREEVAYQHGDVVEAITRREPVKAEQAMRRHITSVYAYLREGG